MRLYVIFNRGRVYLDTDVELLSSLDDLIQHRAWFACENDSINTGLGFGAEAGNDIVKENMLMYETTQDEDWNTLHPCPFYTTQVLKKHGYENEKLLKKKIILPNDVLILPNSYCNPYDWAAKKTRIKRNTVSIHHYAASWQTEEMKRGILEQHNRMLIEKRFGKFAADMYSYLYWSRKKNGGPGVAKRIIGRIQKG